MTIKGAIQELDNLEIPFYQKPSVDKIKETIVDTYQQGRADVLNKFQEELLRLDNADCPQDCECVYKRANCPYVMCLEDVRQFIELLKEQSK